MANYSFAECKETGIFKKKNPSFGDLKFCTMQRNMNNCNACDGHLELFRMQRHVNNFNTSYGYLEFARCKGVLFRFNTGLRGQQHAVSSLICKDVYRCPSPLQQSKNDYEQIYMHRLWDMLPFERKRQPSSVCLFAFYCPSKARVIQSKSVCFLQNFN